MINAKVGEDNEVLIECTVRGTCNEHTGWAQFDSGFSGYITTPLSIAMQLGLASGGIGRIRLADGSIVDVPIYIGEVKIGADEYECPFIIIESESMLMGMSLMKNYHICFNVQQKKASITKGEVSKRIAELYAGLHTIIP